MPFTEAEIEFAKSGKPQRKQEVITRPVGRPKGSKTKSDARKKFEIVLEAGENTELMNHSLEIFTLPKIDTNDPEMVYDRTVEYFEICGKHDMRPTLPGYAMALGISRQTIMKWISGAIPRCEEVLDIVQKVYSLLNSQMEDLMMGNKINPVTAIFLSKNHFAYKDAQEYEVKNEVVAAPSTDALLEEARLLDCVDVTDSKIIDTTATEED